MTTKKEAFITLPLTFTAALNVVYWPTNIVRWDTMKKNTERKDYVTKMKIFFNLLDQLDPLLLWKCCWCQMLTVDDGNCCPIILVSHGAILRSVTPLQFPTVWTCNCIGKAHVSLAHCETIFFSNALCFLVLLMEVLCSLEETCRGWG